MAGRTPAPTIDEKRAREISLKTVARESKRAEDKLSLRDAAIRMAHRDGCSLRDIAEVSGLGHSTIKRIIERRSTED
jgi:DNA-binding NarL/FixJ family response regulator